MKNMKRIINYIIGAATLLAAASCAKNVNWDEVTPDDGQDGITLRFSSGAMTKADGDRLAVNREDYVSRIDYFIFPATEQTVEEDDGTSTTSLIVADDAVYAYKGTVTVASGDELDLEYVETLNPTDAEFAAMFPNGATKAKVFAVANYVDEFGSNNDMEEPNTTLPEEAATWKELHELKVGATFFYDDKDPDFLLRWPHVLPSTDESLFFVMVGEADLELQKTSISTATVPLERLASKVTATFEYEDYLEKKVNKKGEVYEIINWVPQSTAGETRVYLSNAIEHTLLGGPLPEDYSYVADSWGTATKPLGNGTRDIFEYAYNFMNDVPEVDGKKTAHFYTYPINIEAGDDNQPYLKLVLPWYGYKYVGSEEDPTYSATDPNWVLYKQKEVYYKIVLPRETIKEGNRIYEYSVLVNIIGSDKEVQVTGEEYRVKDWSSDSAISSNVATGQYISLDIPKDEYDMYGSSVQILYVSSGEVEISALQIYTEDYANGTVEKEYFINGTKTSYVSPYNASTTDSGNPAVLLPNWVTVNGTQLVINHTMNTNINSSDVDIAPYHFIVTLHLKDAPTTTFDRTVHITQYPPIYVSTIQSYSNTVFLNGEPYSHAGAVYNNHGTSGVGLGQIGNGLVNGTTNTVVTVTTLSSLDATIYTNNGVGTPIIGDPRILLSSNYPTDSYSGTTWGADDLGEESDYSDFAGYKLAGNAYANYIAPKFLIASSYGSNPGTGAWLRNAERCASYQENGYPAGRWRLPTEAEMLFVYTLGNMGLIPQPFNSYRYWANTGRHFVANSRTFTDNSGEGSVRCVYDLWYWGDDKLSNATEWGGFQTDYINE